GSAINTTTDVITKTAHGLQSNDQVMVASSGTLPTGLTANKLYFVIKSSDDTFQLSETYSGSAVDISRAGIVNMTLPWRPAKGLAPPYPATADAFVDVTASSLVPAINYPLGGAPSPYRASYLSGADDLPGQILIEAQDIDDGAFTVS